MVLTGKYTVVGEENFANYLSAMGFPYNYVKYSIDIKQDPDKVTVIKSYEGKSKAVVIPLGVEYEETNALGVVVKCMARFEGDILIVQAGDVTKTYTFTPTGGNIIENNGNLLWLHLRGFYNLQAITDAGTKEDEGILKFIIHVPSAQRGKVPTRMVPFVLQSE